MSKPSSVPPHRIIRVPSATAGIGAGPRTGRRRAAMLIAGVLVAGCAGYILLDEVEGAPTVRTASVAGVHELVVDVGAGPVSLVGGPGRDVGIRSTLHGSATGTPTAEHRLVDGVLTVSASCAGMLLSCHVDEDITVPAGIPVRVTTTAGTVDGAQLDIPSLQVTTTAGSVSAGFVRPPTEVRIATAAGSVELRVPDVGYRVDTADALGAKQIDVVQDPKAARSLSITTAAGGITVRPS